MISNNFESTTSLGLFSGSISTPGLTSPVNKSSSSSTHPVKATNKEDVLHTLLGFNY